MNPYLWMLLIKPSNLLSFGHALTLVASYQSIRTFHYSDISLLWMLQITQSEMSTITTCLLLNELTSLDLTYQPIRNNPLSDMPLLWMLVVNPSQLTITLMCPYSGYFSTTHHNGFGYFTLRCQKVVSYNYD